MREPEKINYQAFRSTVKAILNPEYLDIEVEAKIKEAFDYVNSFYDNHEANRKPSSLYKLSGPNKDQKVIDWHRKNIEINKTRAAQYALDYPPTDTQNEASKPKWMERLMDWWCRVKLLLID